MKLYNPIKALRSIYFRVLFGTLEATNDLLYSAVIAHLTTSLVGTGFIMAGWGIIELAIWVLVK